MLECVRDVFEVLVPRSLTCFSVVGVLATRLPKSNVPLGVFGVLEDPKEANAPDPKPNALDAPAVGDEMEDADGGIALKGVLLLYEELFPCLREKSRA